MNTVIDRVEFQAVAPKRALPGLDYSINRLEALSASIKRVQAQLAGLSSNAAFRLSAKQYQDRAFNTKGVPVLNVQQLARRLGFDPKDVRSAATLIETEIQSAIGKINKAIERNPAMGKRALAGRQQEIKAQQAKSFFSDASGRSFKSTAAAGRFFETYAQLALKDKQRGEAAMMAILSGSVPASAGGTGGPVNAGNLSKVVQDAIAASAGKVRAAQANDKANDKKATASQKAHTATGDGIVETRTITPSNPERPVRTVVKRVVGNNVVEETVHENDEELKTTITDAVGRRAKTELKEQLRQLKAQLKSGLPATAGRKNGMQNLVRDTNREAQLLMEKYGPLGLGGLVTAFTGQTVPDVLASHQKRLGSAGGSLDKQRQAATTAEFITQYRREQSAKAALDKQRNTEQTRNYLAEQKRQADASAALSKQRQKAQTKNYLQETKQAEAAALVTKAQYTVKDLRQRGAIRTHSQTDALTGQVISERYALAGDPNQYHVSYGKGGASVTAVERPAAPGKKDRLTSAIEGLGVRNMAANLIKVTAWGAAVGVLYKSLELASHSLERLEHTGMETAHLGVVFRGVGGDAQALTGDVLALAAAQGRETDEAMESATEWARLGGDRKAINEEVRVSAIAANMANMHMTETTRQLAALMHIYNLESGELNGMLGMLTNTSLKYNVTLEDLFNGLDRSAGAAKIAGVGFAELQAMIGTVVGKTGQSGIVVGNTIKSLLVQFSNPAIQRALRGFGIETLTNTGAQKPGSQVLGEMAGKWDGMDNRSKQDLTRTLVGRLSAARFTPLMDDYIQTQKLAIDAQLNMNKAQEANVNILSTLKAQMAGVRSEFVRMITSFGNQKLGILGGSSPMQALVGGLRTGKNLLGVGGNVAGRIAGASLSTFMPGMGNAGRLGVTTGLFGKVAGAFNDYMDPAGAGSAAFNNTMQELQGRSQAQTRRAGLFDFASARLGRGKLKTEDANLVASEMGSVHAAAFTKAMQRGDTAYAQTVLAAARDRAKQEGEVAATARMTAYNQRLAELNGSLSAKNKDVAALTSRGKNADQETQQAKELADEIQRVTEAKEEDWRRESEANGDLEQVFEMQQKYVNLLKEQADTLELISRLATQVSPKTALQGMDQQVTALNEELALLQRNMDQVMKELPEGPERRQVTDEIRARQKEVEGGIAANTSPVNRGLAQQFDDRAMTIRKVDRDAGAQRYGVDDADKLARERQFLEERKRSTKDATELAAVQSLEFENTLAIRQRQADVEREIKQLAIDQNKEFARSFIGAGPAEMMKKLAAFRMAQNGGLSQGQMFALSPGMRSDYGALSGNNYDMNRLTLEKKKLAAMVKGLPGFAGGGYTGDGPANEIAGYVHKGEVVIPASEVSSPMHGRRPAMTGHPSPAPVSSAVQAERDAFAAKQAEWAAHDRRYASSTSGNPDWSKPASMWHDDEHVHRTYYMPQTRRYADFVDGDMTPHYPRDPHKNFTGYDRPNGHQGYAKRPAGHPTSHTGTGHPSVAAGPGNSMPMPMPMPNAPAREAAGGGNGGSDTTAYKACAAALDLITGSAGRASSALDGLAGRVDKLFAGGSGMQFAPAGQSGGWYPGKTK